MPSADVILVANVKVPMTVTIPNTIGMEYSSAKSSLESLGLKVSLSSAYNYNVAPNVVYAQDISAGQKVEKGTSITLTYSLGAKPIAVGDLVTFVGGTNVYASVAGGPSGGGYKGPETASDHCVITGIYVYNGTTYYQFKYPGKPNPIGWVDARYIYQNTN